MKLAADENFKHGILRGLLRQHSELDIIRVQDTEWEGAEDPELLEWAAFEERVLLSHDVSTMTDFAKERVASGLRMPGLVIIPETMGYGQAIEEILIIALTSFEGELEGQIIFLPL